MSDEGIIQPHKRTSAGNWNPVEGETLKCLLESNTSLSEAEKRRLVSETLFIMSHCVDPKTPSSHNTGLIIGYVQSGKTLSFTSLSALARDNDYQIILLLAGTTNNLVEQSSERLKKDLQFANRNWKIFATQNKAFRSPEVERIKTELHKWQRDDLKPRTIFIVSMKHHGHLECLTTLLSDINLTTVPTLIIDDEGDQAGMNTKALKKEESRTHEQIKRLRDLFPRHSYLLYTATPQAPLLISRIDTLSPDFGAVLTPGDNYIGGKELFVEGKEKYIRRIPPSDVLGSEDNPPGKPPTSMLEALQDFFIGVAIGLCKEEDLHGKNRSMMIHPAIAKEAHLTFANWARDLHREWGQILKTGQQEHPHYKDLLSGFRKAFHGLVKTYGIDFGFDKVQPRLLDAVSDTVIKELNTREDNRIPSVDWESEYSWILIGGRGLDRGFTVEGLTVSYMQRSIGIGTADNIQQRARFFGYKKDYLGLCRIYLTQKNIDAFRDYVSHEESVRQSISEHISNGKKLKDWRRTFVLDRSLIPTRRSVIFLDMYQLSNHKKWIYPDYPHEGSDLVADNREVVHKLLSEFDFYKYKEDGWNQNQIIPAFSDKILLSKIIPFVRQFRYQIPCDSLQHLSIMVVLENIVINNPDSQCSVYAFSGPWCGVNACRSLDNSKPPKIRKLFQGPNKSSKYPGAGKIHSDSAVTFQIHSYDLEKSDGSEVLLKNLPVLAVHIPTPLAERVWLEREEDVS